MSNDTPSNRHPIDKEKNVNSQFPPDHDPIDNKTPPPDKQNPNAYNQTDPGVLAQFRQTLAIAIQNNAELCESLRESHQLIAEQAVELGQSLKIGIESLQKSSEPLAEFIKEHPYLLNSNNPDPFVLLIDEIRASSDNK